jgi:hypothetical protein
LLGSTGSGNRRPLGASSIPRTLDLGTLVSVYTVARELGHGGDSPLKRACSPPGEHPQRAEPIGFRIGRQREVVPQERLRLLPRFVRGVLTLILVPRPDRLRQNDENPAAK